MFSDAIPGVRRNVMAPVRIPLTLRQVVETCIIFAPIFLCTAHEDCPRRGQGAISILLQRRRDQAVFMNSLHGGKAG